MNNRQTVSRRSVLKGLGVSVTIPLVGQTTSAGTSDSWSIIALPDTQYYANSSSNIEFAHDQTEWIVNNLDVDNIKFVSHEGDIVNGAWEITQWDRMDSVMDRLDGVVPYSTPPGNHDWEDWNDKSSSIENYKNYFGPSRYDGRSWFGGAGPNGLCTYQYFQAGGYEFLHLALEWEPRGSVDDSTTALGWADDVLADNPDTPTIVTTHSFLWDEPGEEGRTTFVQETNGDGNSGETVWQNLLEDHPQVFMTLNGHFHEDSGEVHRVGYNEAGYPVYQMLANYQHYDNGGNGWLRKIRFEPGGGADGQDRIAVETYSPSLDSYQTDANSQFHFDLDFDRRFNVDQTNTVSLRQGVDDYGGTVDTYLQEDEPDTDNGAATTLNVDDDDPGGTDRDVQALVRFENLVGSDPDQVPPGVDVVSASAHFRTTNEGAGAAAHRMYTSWDDSDTWNSLGGGVDADGNEAAETPVDTSAPANSKTEHGIDVTDSVQAWTDGETNHGWALLPVGDDGWDFYSAEGDTPPELSVSYDPGDTYKISNVGTGKALDVEYASTDDGANVHQWEYSGGENQQWFLTDRGNGYYTLQAVHSGKVLDVEYASTDDGANVHQWEYAGGENQQWDIERDADGYYRIIARHSGKVLEVEGGSTDDGANVQQWEDAGADHQRWTLEKL